MRAVVRKKNENKDLSSGDRREFKDSYFGKWKNFVCSVEIAEKVIPIEDEQGDPEFGLRKVELVFLYIIVALSSRIKERLVVDRNWDAVAENIGLSKYEARNKWKNLRDHFLKELKRIPQGKLEDIREIAAMYRGKWIYFRMMMFLKDTRLSKYAQEDLPEDSVDNSDFVEDCETENEMFLESYPFSEPVEKIEVNNVLAPSTSAEGNRYCIQDSNEQLSGYESEMLRLENEKVELLRASYTNNDDDDMQFFKSLIPYMKNLLPVRKLHVRNQFQNILIQEISNPNANHDTFQSNIPAPATIYEPPDLKCNIVL
ncbi:hypothetical protein ILUMI_00550 [Ignelater luminosus]|uniref:Transcription factor Adf-1 n=1 Tax=Ignelater luminosus TaxID=2038154 RepID=A0A8K0DG23_IGNLU|nr:hypothetical protein ILUMI_00550 [Ignelater luminosus]